jgi:ABC-2 type transport system permease protein
MSGSSTRSRDAHVVGTLVRRNLSERRRFLAGMTVAAAALATMIAGLYASIGDSYDDILDDLPAALEGMIGDADFSSPEGFVHVELFSFVAPGLTIAAAIAIAAGALAGAEQSGRLSLITASPVRRSRIVYGVILSTLIAIAVVAVGLSLGIAAGAAIGDIGLGATNIAAGGVSVGLLAAAVGAIALAAGAVTGKRGVAVGTGTAVAVAAYAIDAFFPLSQTLDPFAKLSLWYPYGRNQAIINGLDWGYAGILAAVTAGGMAVAVAAFERRDLTS